MRRMNPRNAPSRVPGRGGGAKSRRSRIAEARIGAPLIDDRGIARHTGQVLPTPFAERVLDLVATIPPGRVLTYGDVAERLGSRAPRAVGTTLSRFGGGVPWWRVVRAGGLLPPGHEVAATEHLRAEGVAVLGSPVARRRRRR